MADALLEVAYIREGRFGLGQADAFSIVSMLGQRRKGNNEMAGEHDADFAVLAKDFVHLVKIRAAGGRVAIPGPDLLDVVSRLQGLGLVQLDGDAVLITDRGERLLKLEGSVSDDGLLVRVPKHSLG